MTEFKVGDVVRVKGIAGPNMVVVMCHRNLKRFDSTIVPRYQTLWFTHTSLKCEEVFDAELLEFSRPRPAAPSFDARNDMLL